MEYNVSVEELKSKKWLRLCAAGSVVLVIVLWVSSIWFVPWYVSDWSKAQSSPLTNFSIFGDMFGAVNALFSGLAFAGVIIAILLQREELKLQRKELTQTREEFKRQTIEFEKQNDNLITQQFENTFFNMLNSLNEIIKGIEVSDRYNGHSAKIIGKRALYFLAYRITTLHDKNDPNRVRFPHDLINRKYDTLTSIKDGNHTEISKSFDVFFRYETRGQLASYFITIYTILKFIDQSKFDFRKKKSYSSILRGQLSKNELFLLFYNCLWQEDFIPFRLLVEKYSILKHLDSSEVGKHQLKYYQMRAFDKNASFDAQHYDDSLGKLHMENFVRNEG